MPSDPGLEALMAKIDHIIVLMLENRSFDHMLGYLSLPVSEGGGGRAEVKGLQSGMSNKDPRDGKDYEIRHLNIEDPKDRDPDPCHSEGCVKTQLGTKNDGFVADYVAHHSGDPGYVMGYYNAAELKIYDYLAEQFCICDQWFSSVPGQTWPNRLYALTGHAHKSKDNKFPPLYNEKSFVRHLDENDELSWRWYSHDITSLLLIDPHYSNSKKYFNRFYPFAKENPEWKLAQTTTFLEHVKEGKLAKVSWIDPDFTGPFGSPTLQNDDHPPCDVRAGQQLVRTVCDAVINGPKWKRTLLIITYDEHGGFYDHVPPPPAPDDDTRYGVRVPAFVISPWVGAKQVSSTLFDHTSIIKTILLKFGQPGSPLAMGKRVAEANHLWHLLTEPSSRSVESRSVKSVPNYPFHLPEPKEPRKPTELQNGIEEARKKLKNQGFGGS